MGVLESERLLFRAHQAADLEPYCAMQADPEVRRYVGGQPRTREASERKFREALEAGDSPLSLRATVFKPEGSYIGYCGLYPRFTPQGPAPGEAVLAFYLAHAYWGRGLATEAGRLFLHVGFDEMHLNRIVASVDVRHAASIRVLEKLGFVLVETERGGRSFHHFELLCPHRRTIPL